MNDITKKILEELVLNFISEMNERSIVTTLTKTS